MFVFIQTSDDMLIIIQYQMQKFWFLKEILIIWNYPEAYIDIYSSLLFEIVSKYMISVNLLINFNTKLRNLSFYMKWVLKEV